MLARVQCRRSVTAAGRGLAAGARSCPLRPLPRVLSRPAPGVAGAEPSEEGMKSEKDPFEVPHTGRNAPMSEDKRAATPEQGAAPEGDRAVMGQAWQPTQDDGETPEQRYGSKEAAEEAMESAKDRTKKSEVQTGDTEGEYGEGSA